MEEIPNKRNHPRKDNKTDPQEKHPTDILLWALGMGILIGGLGSILAWIGNDIVGMYKLGAAGFLIGFIGGTIAGLADWLPPRGPIDYNLNDKGYMGGNSDAFSDFPDGGGGDGD